MKKYNFQDRVVQFNCYKTEEVEKSIESLFKEYEKELPTSKNAKIFLKPNYNNDLNSLAGNSTDLRVLVAVLKALKKRGYKNLIIGEGPNSGITHIGIDVFVRLKVDKIAKMFGAKLVNLNFGPSEVIELTNRNKTKVSKFYFDCDYFINMPKIKTHMETVISICIKNLMGGLQRIEKRKMHDNLLPNLVRLGEVIRPNLNIVDGLVAMEGDGPGDGTPKKVGIILGGKNHFTMDLLCSKLFGFNYKKVPHLKIAVEKGLISNQDVNHLKNIKPILNLKKAKINILAKLLLKNFFVRKRYSKVLDFLFSGGPIPYILYKLKVRQDTYVKDNGKIELCPKIKNQERYLDCCPLRLKSVRDTDCIKCLYCYFMHPDKFEVKGRKGFLDFQIKKYLKYTKNL